VAGNCVSLTVFLTVSLTRCPTVSLSLYLSRCVSLSLSLCLSLTVSLTVSLSVSLSLCLSLCLSLSLSHSVSHCVSLTVSHWDGRVSARLGERAALLHTRRLAAALQLAGPSLLQQHLLNTHAARATLLSALRQCVVCMPAAAALVQAAAVQR
jgi:hypothetical protein